MQGRGGRTADGLSIWLKPLGYLLVASAVFVLIPSLIDRAAFWNHREDLSWIQNLPEVFAGIIGIAITVVAIIVELAATRYTARITELFFKNRTNSVVMTRGVAAPKLWPGCWVRSSSSRPSIFCFSRMATNSISGVMMPARA